MSFIGWDKIFIFFPKIFRFESPLLQCAVYDHVYHHQADNNKWLYEKDNSKTCSGGKLKPRLVSIGAIILSLLCVLINVWHAISILTIEKLAQYHNESKRHDSFNNDNDTILCRVLLSLLLKGLRLTLVVPHDFVLVWSSLHFPLQVTDFANLTQTHA